MQTTSDGLLDNRITVEQPAKGFRIAVDTLLLAAAVPAQAGEKIVDLGCGVGGAMLALACRVAGVRITGIEIQPELIELCRRNIEHNRFGRYMDVIKGDVTNAAMQSDFDHAMINPPYHDEATHDPSPNHIKRTANTAKDDLPQWIATAARLLKPSGTLVVIHRADRQDELLAALAPHFGTARVLPILPKSGAPPKRVIVRAAKAVSGMLQHIQPLVLHKGGGGYTDAAESILRHAQPLSF